MINNPCLHFIQIYLRHHIYLQKIKTEAKDTSLSSLTAKFCQGQALYIFRKSFCV